MKAEIRPSMWDCSSVKLSGTFPGELSTRFVTVDTNQIVLFETSCITGWCTIQCRWFGSWHTFGGRLGCCQIGLTPMLSLPWQECYHTSLPCYTWDTVPCRVPSSSKNIHREILPKYPFSSIQLHWNLLTSFTFSLPSLERSSIVDEVMLNEWF